MEGFNLSFALCFIIGFVMGPLVYVRFGLDRLCRPANHYRTYLATLFVLVVLTIVGGGVTLWLTRTAPYPSTAYLTVAVTTFFAGLAYSFEPERKHDWPPKWVLEQAKRRYESGK